MARSERVNILNLEKRSVWTHKLKIITINYWIYKHFYTLAQGYP